MWRHLSLFCVFVALALTRPFDSLPAKANGEYLPFLGDDGRLRYAALGARLALPAWVVAPEGARQIEAGLFAPDALTTVSGVADYRLAAAPRPGFEAAAAALAGSGYAVHDTSGAVPRTSPIIAAGIAINAAQQRQIAFHTRAEAGGARLVMVFEEFRSPDAMPTLAAR